MDLDTWILALIATAGLDAIEEGRLVRFSYVDRIYLKAKRAMPYGSTGRLYMVRTPTGGYVRPGAMVTL